ncbi:hypothetical protein KIPB_013914, partial [Kipferlia bialata]
TRLTYLNLGHSLLTNEEVEYVNAVLANPAGKEAERHISKLPELRVIGWRSIALGLMTSPDWSAVTSAMILAYHRPKVSVPAECTAYQRAYSQLFAPCQKWKENALRML